MVVSDRDGDRGEGGGIVSHFLDFIVRCGEVRIAIRVTQEDASRDAYKASLDPIYQGDLVVIERGGRIIERWSGGERRES